MDVSEYNKIVHYKKLSTTSSKLLTRKEPYFRTKLRSFTVRDGKLCRNGKQVLHSEDAYPTPLKVHQDKGHSNRVQLETLAPGKYHVEWLRPISQRIVTQRENCQQLIEVRKTGLMVHINSLRVSRLCNQLRIPLDRTKPLSRVLQK